MNKNDYRGLIEHDDVLNNFLTAILEIKLDALNFGNAGLSNGASSELKTLYYNIADEWLKNYFDNFSDWNYDEFKKRFKPYRRRSNKLKIKE